MEQPLFTREDAVAELTKIGFRWFGPACEFRSTTDDTARGRLCYAPNPADPDSKEYPRIWLQKPGNEGIIPLLP